MRVPKPPMEFLIDEFEYHEIADETGSWGESTFKEPVAIKAARIDRTAQYTSDGTGKHLLYNAVLFCYEGLSKPMPAFKEQSKIVFDGQEHILTKVIPIYEPYTNKIYSYELEVV
ncbi:hypothetical protein M2149_000782 [Lachnospiraceae bacterium PFB1-21]